MPEMLKKPLVDAGLHKTSASSVGEGASSSGTPATSAAPSPAPTLLDKSQVEDT